MEDGCTLSSSDDNQVVDGQMESFLPNLKSPDLQHLQLKGDRLAWKSSLDSLKSFVMCDLKQQGKWTSPGGNTKQFKSTNNNVIINWYSKKQQTLCFQGRDGPTLKERLVQLVQSMPEMTTNTPDSNTSTTEFLDDSIVHSSDTQDEEKPIKTNSHIQDQEIYSFIEAKVREVCRHEIEQLKSEASSSYANETISSLQKENDTLKQKLQELESRHTSMKQESTTLIDENKSLMTAIRLLNNELQAVLKADDVKLKADDVSCSRLSERPDKKEWQAVGANKEKEKSKTRKRNPEKNEKEPQYGLGNNAQTRKPVTVIAGDSIIQNIRGWSLSRTNKVVVKPFPGATTEDMEDFIKPILRKDPENIIIHVGTNDVNSKEPRLTAEGIVNLAHKIEGDAPNTSIAISGLVPRADDKGGKVSSVNKILKKFCRQNQWNFIEHNNLNLTHLNRGGLHLSKSGTALVAENFCKYID